MTKSNRLILASLLASTVLYSNFASANFSSEAISPMSLLPDININNILPIVGGNYIGNTVNIVNGPAGTISGTVNIKADANGLLSNSGTILSGTNIHLQGNTNVVNDIGGKMIETTLYNEQGTLNFTNKGTTTNFWINNDQDPVNGVSNIVNEAGATMTGTIQARNGTTNMENKAGASLAGGNLFSNIGTFNVNNHSSINGSTLGGTSGGVLNINNQQNGIISGNITTSTTANSTTGVMGQVNINNTGGKISSANVTNNGSLLGINNAGVIDGTNAFTNQDDTKVVDLNNNSNGVITGTVSVKEGTLNLDNISGGTINNAVLSSNSGILNVNNGGLMNGANTITGSNGGSANIVNNAGGMLGGSLNLNGTVNNLTNEASGTLQNLNLVNNSNLNHIDNSGLITSAIDSKNIIEQVGGGDFTINNLSGGDIANNLEIKTGNLIVNNQNGGDLLNVKLTGQNGNDLNLHNSGNVNGISINSPTGSSVIDNLADGVINGTVDILSDTLIKNAGLIENAIVNNNQPLLEMTNTGDINNMYVNNKIVDGVTNLANQSGGNITGLIGNYDGTLNLNNETGATIKDAVMFNYGNHNFPTGTPGVLNVNNAGTISGSNGIMGAQNGNINLNNQSGGDLSGYLNIAGVKVDGFNEDYLAKVEINNEAGGSLHDIAINNTAAELKIENAGNMSGISSIASDSDITLNNNGSGSITGQLHTNMNELTITNNDTATFDATVISNNVVTIEQNAANVLNSTIGVNIHDDAIVGQALNLSNNNAAGEIKAMAMVNVNEVNLNNDGKATVDLMTGSKIVDINVDNIAGAEATINNSGNITGNITGTNLGNAIINNSGGMSGNYDLAGGTVVLNNLTDGTIGNETIKVADGTLTLNNTGSLGNNTSIEGSVSGTNVTVNNLAGGLLTGDLEIKAGVNPINNAGNIAGLNLTTIVPDLSIINTGVMNGNNVIDAETSFNLTNEGSGIINGNIVLNVPETTLTQNATGEVKVNLQGTSADAIINLNNSTLADISLSGDLGNLNVVNTNLDINIPGITVTNTGTIHTGIDLNNLGNTIIGNIGVIIGDITDILTPPVPDTECPEKVVTINNSGHVVGNVSVKNNILKFNNTATGLVTSQYVDARDLRLNNAGTFNTSGSYVFEIRDHLNAVNTGSIIGKDYAFKFSGDNVTGTMDNSGLIMASGTTIGYDGQNLLCPSCYPEKTLTLNNTGRIISAAGGQENPNLGSKAIDAKNMVVNNNGAGIIAGSIHSKDYNQQSGATWVSFMNKETSQMNTILAENTVNIQQGASLYAYTNNDVRAFTDGQKFKIATVNGMNSGDIENQLDNFILKSDSPFANFEIVTEGKDGYLEFTSVAPTTYATAADLATSNHNATILGSQRIYENFANRDSGSVTAGMASGDAISSDNKLSFLPLGGYANFDSNDGHAGFKSKYYGGIGYYEHRFDKHWKGGIGLAYLHNNNDYKDTNKSDSNINSYRPFLFGGYDDGKWKTELALGIAKHKVENDRRYVFNNSTYQSRSKYDADEISGHLNIGYQMKTDEDIIIQPMVGAYAARLKTDSYSEKGSGPMNMHISSDDYNSVKSMLGIKFAKEYTMDNGTIIKPELHVRWYHELGDTQGGVSAYFLAQEQLFNTSGIKAPKDVGDIALRLTTKSGDNLDLFTEAYYQFGTKFYNAGATLGLQYNM